MANKANNNTKANNNAKIKPIGNEINSNKRVLSKPDKTKKKFL